ncbi:hypothetical protein ARMSODRAFT_72308 [Armillaria solidipes]|uniref:F-box domain-containing protein n=1 Tax=Armillaria solidipes TaxID=1076256 RepID=A0A2H3BKE3_9AGAR|nr:hypothetical protein ARMSODRAFT_72308 [Armillaria solidipes]
MEIRLGPIYTLPEELFFSVFSTLIQSWDPWPLGRLSYMESPWILTLICKSWRVLLFRSPLLWKSYFEHRPIFGTGTAVYPPPSQLYALLSSERFSSVPLSFQVRLMAGTLTLVPTAWVDLLTVLSENRTSLAHPANFLIKGRAAMASSVVDLCRTVFSGDGSETIRIGFDIDHNWTFEGQAGMETLKHIFATMPPYLPLTRLCGSFALSNEQVADYVLFAQIISHCVHLTHLKISSPLDKRIAYAIASARPPLSVFDCNNYIASALSQVLWTVRKTLVWLNAGSVIRVTHIGGTVTFSSGMQTFVLPPSGFPLLREIHIAFDDSGTGLLAALGNTRLPTLSALRLHINRTSDDLHDSERHLRDFQYASAFANKYGQQTKFLTLDVLGEEEDCVQSILNQFPNLEGLALGSIGLSCPCHATLRNLRIQYAWDENWPLLYPESGRFPVLKTVGFPATQWTKGREDLQARGIGVDLWEDNYAWGDRNMSFWTQGFFS